MNSREVFPDEELRRRIMDFTMAAGQTLLENGAEVFRVEQTMEIMARSFHLREFHVYVLTNGIFASAGTAEISEVRNVPTRTTHLGRVAAVNALSREIAEGSMSLDEAESRLVLARRIPFPKAWVQLVSGMCGAFCFALIFGGIGFLDDFEKVKHKQNLGLTALQKFLLQLAAAVAFLCLMRFEGMLTFFNTQIVMSWWVYMVFAAFVIVGTVNAVNITDGIDGLAGSVTVPVGLFFTVLAIWWQGYEQLGIYAAALVGGSLGFLIYNFHPAKVFMGDTGSLFLGGTVAALAFAYDMPLVLIPVGFVYICETLSDILQVIYFKATHGKRLFKMAPLHHHFELCGWSEVKLVAVFTSVSALCCLAALFGVLNRFHF